MQSETFENNPADQIVIACVGKMFWLMQGERHLSAMLSGQEPYPTPAMCVTFESVNDLVALLGTENVDIDSLWNINDAIVARMRRADEITDIDPPRFV